MKKFNKNSIVFVFVFVFILFGFCGDFVKEMSKAAKELINDLGEGNLSGITEFTSAVNDGSTESLRYHDEMMDLDSVKQNLLGTKVIQKDGDTIVKTASGTLIKPQGYLSDEAISGSVERIGELYDAVKESGANFLYVAAPTKGYGMELPANVTDHKTSNFDRYTEALMSAGIPTLDLAQALKEENLLNDQTYFMTDHHWTPEIGLRVSGMICETLGTSYGFAFNASYADPANYNIEVYENWFLGSYGKKVGTFFAEGGADDISLITPKFETSLIEEQPFKNQKRTGSFEETVLYLSNLKEKDYYEKNPYAAYSGGDFRLQIVKNELCPEGKKVLLIRDSFACAVMPFLSLQTKELHVVDVRDYSYFVGEKMNIYSYIEEIKPDYVLVLYSGASGVKGSSGKYDFE